MLRLNDPTSLSLLFHLNSEPWLNDEAYKTTTALQEFKQPVGVLSEVSLPAPDSSALTRLLTRRRSCRSFAPEKMTADSLSAVLAAAYGIVDTAPFGGSDRFLRRSVPSAGGLFPLELYAAVRRVSGIEDGLHHYDVIRHGLRLLSRGDLFPTLEQPLYPYVFACDANVILFFTAVFLRTQRKYGPRGYRYILLEAGHAAQNACLRAAELGLSTLCMGGFVDSDLAKLLGLDSASEGVVYSMAVGFAKS
jgi:SagB-type dehydrogenase family enzyme